MRDENKGAVAFNKELGPLLSGEEDPARLWAEIHLLRAALQGPTGFATWQKAAVAERIRRTRMQTALNLAANRLERLSLELSDKQTIQGWVDDWANEARAACKA